MFLVLLGTQCTHLPVPPSVVSIDVPSALPPKLVAGRVSGSHLVQRHRQTTRNAYAVRTQVVARGLVLPSAIPMMSRTMLPPMLVAGADSGQVRPYHHPHSTRHRVAVRMDQAARQTAPCSEIPTRPGCPRRVLTSPAAKRRPPPTWLAWGHPRATASGPCGS